MEQLIHIAHKGHIYRKKIYIFHLMDKTIKGDCSHYEMSHAKNNIKSTPLTK